MDGLIQRWKENLIYCFAGFHSSCLAGEICGVRLWMRRKLLAKMIKASLFVILLVTVAVNLFFIVETAKRLQHPSHSVTGSELV